MMLTMRSVAGVSRMSFSAVAGRCGSA
jgi:hypothetical protein